MIFISRRRGRNSSLEDRNFKLCFAEPAEWATGKYGVDGRDIGSRTYFRGDETR
jgi:hypothetical protein